MGRHKSQAPGSESREKRLNLGGLWRDFERYFESNQRDSTWDQKTKHTLNAELDEFPWFAISVAKDSCDCVIFF